MEAPSTSERCQAGSENGGLAEKLYTKSSDGLGSSPTQTGKQLPLSPPAFSYLFPPLQHLFSGEDEWRSSRHKDTWESCSEKRDIK